MRGIVWARVAWTKVVWSGVLVLMSIGNAAAQEWSRGLFSTSIHDFGTVAKAAKTEHRFTFENRSQQTMRIRSVRASCGCTTPIIETQEVGPGQIGSILARFNTDTFSGKRQATLTVTFDKPSFTEVQLLVKGYIRSDIVFNPGEASFGVIREGEGKTLGIDVDYAGRSDWQIQEVISNDPFVQVQAVETSRGNGRVRYRLEAAISPEASSGILERELVVVTNDRNLTKVPLRLTANIKAPLSISPPRVTAGQVRQGEPWKQIFIVKGAAPFQIKGIRSEEFDVTFQGGDSSAALHRLEVALQPKVSDAEVVGKIWIETDLADQPEVVVDVTCKPQVASPD
ncbi:MAG: DUF1573 domain-containing protein [Pirellulaceae bacterium]